MIIVRLSSGLGNQMYQYNFYRLLKERYKDVPVKADLRWFYANNDHHGYELNRIFAGNADFEIEEASFKEICRVTGQIPAPVKGPLAGKIVYLLGPVNRIIREHAKEDKSKYRIDQLDGDISNKWIVDESGNRVNPLYEKVMNLDLSKDWYITGFWIEERYVKPRMEKIKKEFIFPKADDEHNLKMLDKIKAENSVSLHVRRGDYLSATYASMFKSLGRDYYEKAVNEIKKMVDKPTFYLFSDDPEYMKEAFDWLDNKTIVDINSGNNSFRDMQLMSACKHNIIANSTFSQWGAMLNDNQGHITIYPKAYLSDEDTEEKSLPGWVRI